MKIEHSVSASKAGKEQIRLEPTTVPVVKNGADDLEEQLARILARVPTLFTLPKSRKKCSHTGLSRTCMLELVAPCDRNEHKPPVRAIYRRSHKHAVRGRWYIPAENLFRYLLSLEAGSVEAYSQLAAERKQGKA